MAKQKSDLDATHLGVARRGVSRTLRSTALLMLGVAVVLYLLMWWSALRMHMVPSSWGSHGAAHGPWRHTSFSSGLQNLRQLWYNVLWACCCAALAAMLALAVAPSWRRVRLLIVCGALAGIYFYTHQWLVD